MPRDFEDSPPPSPAVLAFLEKKFEDEAAGRSFPLEHYLALFPDVADAVRREWARLDASASSCSTEAPIGAPKIGERFGPYAIVRRLGRGGFGIVYLATDTRVDRPVAIKFLGTGADVGDESLKRFRREAESIARLDHPGIGALYDAHLEAPTPYLVMRYVEGETLAAALSRAKGSRLLPLTFGAETRDREAAFRSLAAFFEAAARAIAVAHKNGVVHRDLKPANIMVTPDGAPVVLDFGLARRAGDETLTRSEEIIGTLSYMAPEAIAGRALDRRADVYALGATLYECLVLEKPFVAPTSQSLMRKIAEDEPRAPHFLVPDVPRDLEAITLAALEKSPALRYADAAAFADDLAAFCRGDEVSAKRPSSLGRVMRRARRRPAVAALAVLIVLGVPLVVGLLWSLKRQRPAVIAAAARAEREAAEKKIEEGFFLVGQWQSEKALALFDAALAHDPDDVTAIGGKTLALIILKRAAEATAFLESRRAIVARSPALGLLLADARAVEAGGAAATGAPAAPEPGDQGAPIYSYFLGWRALRRGEAGDSSGYPDALRAFSDAVATSPTARAIFHFEQARAAGLAADAEVAKRAAAAIRTLWPKSVNGAFYAAFGLTGAGAFPEAIVEFRRALALEPQHRMSELGLGAALMGEGDFDGAITLYGDVLARDPKDWTAHQNIGGAYLQKGDPDRALPHFLRVLDLDPESPELHRGLLDVYGRKEDGAGLERELRRWVGLFPDDPGPLADLATYLADLADPAAKAEAKTVAARALAAIQAGKTASAEVKEAVERLAR